MIKLKMNQMVNRMIVREKRIKNPRKTRINEIEKDV